MFSGFKSRRIYSQELAWSLFIVVMLELALYVLTADTLSVSSFVKSVGEIFLAPFYPGIFLVYPTVVVAILIGSFMYSCRVNSRGLRVTLYGLALSSWVAIGLVSIVKWYH